MGLKTFVKVSRVDSLSDARYCAGMMVDVLGFNLQEGTDGFVDAEKFNEITNWVAGVKFCGEFKDAQVAEIKIASANHSLDFIETQVVDQLEELSELDINLILKIVIDQKENVDSLHATINYAKDLVSHIVISSQKPELYQLLNDALTSIDSEETHIICSYNITPETIQATVDTALFKGIELEGTSEERPGLKDYDNVMDVLEVLDED